MSRVLIREGGQQFDVGLLDGTQVSLHVSADSTAAAVASAVGEAIGLETAYSYALFVRRGHVWLPLRDEETISEALRDITESELSSGAVGLYCRRVFFLPDEMSETEKQEDAVACRMAFYDALYHFRYGFYRFSPQDAVLLAALALSTLHGTFDPDRHDAQLSEYLKQLLPSYILTTDVGVECPYRLRRSARALGLDKIQELVQATWERLDVSMEGARTRFLDMCMRGVSYGAAFFLARRDTTDEPDADKTTPINSLVAINSRGVQIWSVDDPLAVEEHTFFTVPKWAMSPDKKIFAFTTTTEEIVCFVTENARYMHDCMDLNVDMLVAARNKGFPAARKHMGAPRDAPRDAEVTQQARRPSFPMPELEDPDSGGESGSDAESGMFEAGHVRRGSGSEASGSMVSSEAEGSGSDVEGSYEEGSGGSGEEGSEASGSYEEGSGSEGAGSGSEAEGSYAEESEAEGSYEEGSEQEGSGDEEEGSYDEEAGSGSEVEGSEEEGSEAEEGEGEASEEESS